MIKKRHNISLDKAYDIIKKPITTEKSTNLQQFNQYSFVVSKNSNSFETFKGQYGFRKDIKRAIVTLVEGNTIDASLEIK